MGGNAFANIPVIRIQREQIPATLEYVVRLLAFPGFTTRYASDNLMGSAGKQASSGDLDFAINNHEARFHGEPTLPVFDLRALAARCREVLPETHVATKTLKGGQFQTAWPIMGDPLLGYVQVDFIAGDPEWLKFSHWSPGKDVSPWKGVLISTMLGVLAKHNKEFEILDDEGKQRARVGWHFDLEKGLHRKWKLRLREGHGMNEVTPDYFETHVPDCPRFPRLGYLTNPEAVLSILFRRSTIHENVDTFEKIVQRVKECYDASYDDIAERFVEAFLRSAGRHEYSRETVEDVLRR